MSKKKHRKRRYNSGKNKTRLYDHGYRNKHHLLWIKSKWHGRYANKLRMHEYCVVTIPQNTLHKAIHCKMDEIPVASESSCKAVLSRLETEMVNNTISLTDAPPKRLKWLIAQFSELEPSTAKALEQQLHIIREFEWQEFLLKLP